MASKIDYKSIHKCLANNSTFAAYTLANKKEFTLIISQKEKTHKLSSFSELDSLSGFVFIPFSESKHPAIFIEPDFCFKEGEVDATLDNLRSHPITYSQKKLSSTPKKIYLEHFDQMMQALEASEFSKLVLSRIHSIDRKEEDLSEVFKLLNLSYPSHFNYIFNSPESGCWIGSSPEILYEETENQAKTIALAGTQRKNSNSADEYIWRAKELKEQAFVVDYIEEILNNSLHGSYQKSDSTAIAANVVHLKTTFTFDKTKVKSKGTLINDLHPTPAVCGLPKLKAQGFIEKTESHDREYYAGFLGPVNLDSQSNLFVNLRCLKVGETQFHLFVGGGITKDSNAQKEWEETELKAETLLSIINKI